MIPALNPNTPEQYPARHQRPAYARIANADSEQRSVIPTSVEPIIVTSATAKVIPYLSVPTFSNPLGGIATPECRAIDANTAMAESK